jgi:23S rRNA (adenine2503-C2)-methyltransferase
MSSQSNNLVSLELLQPAPSSRTALFGLDAPTLQKVVTEAGEPVWRVRQLTEALYRQRVATLEQVTTLPLALRRRLVEQGLQIGRPGILQEFRSSDGTERYLIEGVAGPDTVEAVWMPEGDEGELGDGVEDEGRSWIRATICASSQVGCAVNCQFCLTARLGLQRNLTSGEIAGQIVTILDRHGVEIGKDRINVVFMGMGEPLLNYDNWMAAVRILVQEVGISPLRMTVSTSGIVPGIERLAQEPDSVRPKLAISLNAPNDRIRSEVMPINRKWPIHDVLEAARAVHLRNRERVTLEYVLLGGVTDGPEHAKQLAQLVRSSGIALKVNLIAWNPGPGVPYRTPQSAAVEGFRQALAAEDVPVYLRKPRGRDIFAACGQLKRTVESL